MLTTANFHRQRRSIPGRYSLAFTLSLSALAVSAASAQRPAARPPAAAVKPAAAQLMTSDLLRNISLRSLGPGLVTGRVADIEIDPGNPNIWYIATAFGGVWKTTNRGMTFAPILDDGGATNTCCIVIDPNNSNILWLGTGENNSQRSAHCGDGMHKTVDAGKTWKRMGLELSEHIGKS